MEKSGGRGNTLIHCQEEESGSGMGHQSVLRLQFDARNLGNRLRALSFRLPAQQGHFRERAGRFEKECGEGGLLHCTGRKCAKGIRIAASGPG